MPAAEVCRKPAGVSRAFCIAATTHPGLRALLEAPPDDERRAVHEAREELARGEMRTLEKVRRELGG